MIYEDKVSFSILFLVTATKRVVPADEKVLYTNALINSKNNHV